MSLMICPPSEQVLQKVLQTAIDGGADFAEVFFESTVSGTLALSKQKIETALQNHICGVGLRVVCGFKTTYFSSCEFDEASLMTLANRAKTACKGDKKVTVPPLNAITVPNLHPAVLPPDLYPAEKKAALLHRADMAARSVSEKIVQVNAGLAEKTQFVRIANSTGLCVDDTRIRVRFNVNVTASDGTQNQTGHEAPGASCGYELFENMDIEALARSAATTAVTMLSAMPCPAGVFPVAIENGFGGVIFHEACGHSLESEAVAKGNSEFAGKIGTQIASEKVTAIDDGTIAGAWGSTNIDDAGAPTQRNVLIEHGILKSYMVGDTDAGRLGCSPTGSTRRESYLYAPVSRMRNTYIAPGTDSFDDIIGSIDHGLYCKQMGGGSVNPVTGEFNFAVSEGYLVKNGVICEPVRGASLIGKGSKVLFDIDMVSDNLAFGQGMCDAASGSVPTNVGQPLIRLKEIVVGGAKS